MGRVTWLEAQALSGSFVSLIANEPQLYEKWGYQLTAPYAQGIYRLLKIQH
ncbi:hypothetical protein [Xenorhabdus hominickii]|uniref:GCN5 family acetyltransferase n=1 Tax=Xenorhabdus hominickii TaxID=351679 RepID=A0A2G0Q1B1_XENHO|nr:hypothetical protein [Xenorhabdus hominickii]PHM53003.1 hypothetical protein Xhom_03885 [Xenorhabdus hominickii]